MSKYLNQAWAVEWFKQDGFPGIAELIDRIQPDLDIIDQDGDQVYLVSERILSLAMTTGQFRTLIREIGYYVEMDGKFVLCYN